MKERTKLLLESLPEWAREAMMQEETPSPSAAAPAAALDEETALPLLLQAAVVWRFLPRDLAPRFQGPARLDAERLVLSFSEISHGPDGPKWTLRPQKRVEVLNQGLATGALYEALATVNRNPADPVNAVLVDAIEAAPLPEELAALETRRTAVAMLSGVRGISLPSLADLDREIELRRLLGIFERMTGRSNGKERFFGRAKELDHLRDYVGVIRAEGVKGLIFSGLRQAVRMVSGRAPLCVWGFGGVGKTTLISKFMLEHAAAARSRFPFSYLDFDRTTISARRRAGLLAEMCLQTGAQFPELAEPMTALRERVEEHARRMIQLKQRESMTALLPFAREFRTEVDRYLDESESLFEWARPFLLVFDTFEVVQYSEDDVRGLEQFVRGFSLEGETGMWSRLRLILSGRKQVLHFIQPVEELQPPLGALDRDGSAALLVVLAEDARRPIKMSDALGLVEALAIASGQPKTEGLHPLRLRLIGELFRGAKMSGQELVRSLVLDLQSPHPQANLAVQKLIDGVLIRRVLGHVADPRVRSLADPGLVVRRITPDVIQHVMTRGTTDPAAGEADDSDSPVTAPWIVSAEEAAAIYETFQHEVSLVDAEGDSLRHRADVREQMLPLIRYRRPNRFRLLNQLAYDYYSAKAATDPSDFASATEALYHGLWLNKPVEELDAYWRKSPSFDPRIDTGEFGEDTVACAYVCAKSGARLTADQLRLLPRHIVLEWLEASTSGLLKETRIESSIFAVRAIAGENFELLDDRDPIAAPVTRLLYRTGRWNDVVQLCRRHLAASHEPYRSHMVRTLVTVIARSGAVPEELDRLLAVTESTSDPETRVEMLAQLAIAFMRAGRTERAAELRGMVSEAARLLDDNHWRQEHRIVRLWAVAGPFEDDRPLRLWVEARERMPRGIPMMERLPALLGLGQSELPPASLDVVWRQARPAILRSGFPDLKPLLWALAAFEHSDWVRAMGNALTRAINSRTIAVSGGEDGFELVQARSEGGMLLSYAERFVKVADARGMQPNQYPADVFDLARALLGWHDAIVKFAPPGALKIVTPA